MSITVVKSDQIVLDSVTYSVEDIGEYETQSLLFSDLFTKTADVKRDSIVGGKSNGFAVVHSNVRATQPFIMPNRNIRGTNSPIIDTPQTLYELFLDGTTTVVHLTVSKAQE